MGLGLGLGTSGLDYKNGLSAFFAGIRYYYYRGIDSNMHLLSEKHK